MSAIRIYLDENVHSFIAEAVRLRGWDATTTAAQGQLGADDLDQLSFAALHGYAILTYNQRDFARIHYELIQQGSEHGGILLGFRQDPHRTLRGLLRLLSEVASEEMRNRLEYLSNWA